MDQQSTLEIKQFINSALDDLKRSLIEEINTLKSEMAARDKKIQNLEGQVQTQSIRILQLERESLKNNLVITGIEEDRDAKEILDIITDEKSESIIHSYYKIGKLSNNKNRPLVVKFNNFNNKLNILKKGKSFRTDNRLQGIYINNHLTSFDRDEQFRLREKLRDLKRDDADANIRIYKNSIYHDEKIIYTANYFPTSFRN